ncbi:uncharacterized protein I303_100794 [Kwoniella dejecticola CBS 10117]|uniref:Bud emergence protein 1 n=1 Tax=Kwoniella dejecticola CBS 10117 TaxID=1296121 RepID=A0A1A6AG04_9TREE|nr:bud emergence protein 1 [Kwoniella dejecticola CBS 10117]OBR88976.1 bud emergence protein 1 [Kwoniella dejecticola CBS 10117]
MKSLRRSLNNNNQNNPSSSSSSPAPSPPLPVGNNAQQFPLGRPSQKVAPPQKVIKALESHRSTNPQELSYNKGDFWYVTGERNEWFEALNPLTGSRGLVPKADFEEFVKGGRHPSGQKSIDQGNSGRPYTPSQGHLSHTSDPRSPPGTNISPPLSADSARSRPKAPVYAIVQYDFHAERPDELDAKKGEPIVVIAQSNHEWFVAKPIGRLGGPGLIPVTFVEIRDPVTGKPVDMNPNMVPAVEEWKKATADYKAAAIPLGRFDITPEQAVTNSPYAPAQSSSAANSQSSLPRTGSTNSVNLLPNANGRISQGTRHTSNPPSQKSAEPVYKPEQDAMFPPGELTSLGVPSFHYESGNYWFRIHVNFVPDEPSAPAYTLNLYRTYEDFYDFQINLLDTFPYEAGRSSKPGEEDRTPPERILPYMPGPVDDEIDDELTEYRREELDAYVRALIDLRSRQAGYILRHDLIRTFFAAKYGDDCEAIPREDVMGELEERLAEVTITQSPAAESSLQHQHQRGLSADVSSNNHSRSQSSQSRHSQNQSLSISQQQQDRYSPQPYLPGHQSANRSISSRGASPLPPIDTSSSSRPPSNSGVGMGAGQNWTNGGGAGPLSANSSSTHPMPNSAGGQPPYIKIKIYDRATDDLIAIRVHPSVSHSELFEKVRARLGPNISSLRYRSSMDGGNANSGYRELRDDRELREWMRAEDQKLVLYAE